MSWLSELFDHKDRNPYRTGGKVLEDVPGQYGQPSKELYDKIAAEYKPSPGYDFKLHQAMNAANNAAGAGGYLGTGQNQYESADLAHNVADQDFETYMKNRLNIGDTLGTNKTTQAKTAAQAAEWDSEHTRKKLEQIIKFIGIAGGGTIGALTTVGNPAGVAAGGFAGAKAGDWLSNKLLGKE